MLNDSRNSHWHLFAISGLSVLVVHDLRTRRQIGRNTLCVGRLRKRILVKSNNFSRLNDARIRHVYRNAICDSFFEVLWSCNAKRTVFSDNLRDLDHFGPAVANNILGRVNDRARFRLCARKRVT